MIKYYWLVFQTGGAQGASYFYEMVCTEHPFEVVRKQEKENKSFWNGSPIYTIINWKEISSVEYNLFKQLNPEPERN